MPALVERAGVTARHALVDGVRRVRNAPIVFAGAWLMTLLASLPLTIVMWTQIRQNLGSSLVAESAANSVNLDWMQQFADQTPGIGMTFTPSIIGFGAVLENLSAFIDRVPRPVPIAATAAFYIGAWLFLAGGIIDRYARMRPTRAAGFFAACGVFFFRFLRLGLVAALVYGVVFGPLHDWLFDDLYSRLTDQVTVERTAFAVRFGLYAVFAAVLALCSLVFDYAKIRAVVEDRRSMLLSIAAAVRFLRQERSRALRLYLLDVALVVVLMALYAAVAPAGAGAGWRTWIGFALGQLYVAGRVYAKLVFWASETALFQQTLAHAGYVARQEAQWPDSPTVEAVRRIGE
jgi:hypothetical protein